MGDHTHFHKVSGLVKIPESLEDGADLVERVCGHLSVSGRGEVILELRDA